MQLHEAKECLLRGGLVGIPTDTVYGLAVDATNPQALERLIQVKSRPPEKPFCCLMPSAHQVAEYGWMDSVADRLADFWPGALTLLLKQRRALPQELTMGSEWTGFRVPDQQLTLSLLELVGRPLAVSSANGAGEKSATTALELQANLGDRVDGILDGGPSPLATASTILRTGDGKIDLIRPGALSVAELNARGFEIVSPSIEVS